MGTRGELLYQLGRLAEADACLEEAVARALQLQELDYLYDDRLRLALVRAERGDLAGARAALAAAEAATIHRDDGREAALLDTRGRVALLAGDTQSALAPLRAQIEYVRSLEWRTAVAPALEHLAWALAALGDMEEAAALLAEARREREATGTVLYPVEIAHHERAVALVGRWQ